MRNIQWREARFRQFLKDNSKAKTAINNLVCDNCPETRLVALLRAASAPNQNEGWSRFLREWAPTKQRGNRLSRMLKQASSELRRYVCSPFGALPLMLHRSLENAHPAAFYGETVEDPRTLADAMEKQADSLCRWNQSAIATILTRSFSFRSTWKHVPLALAARVVRRRSGRIPWSDLAYALEAVAAGYGIDADVSPDALRREQDRFLHSKAGKAFESSDLKTLLNLFLS